MVVPRQAFAAACVGVLLSTNASALDFQVTRLDDPPPDGCLAGDCSLREAVMTSNQLSGHDRIALTSGLHLLTIPGTATGNPAVGDLDILDSVEIVGDNADDTVILASHNNRHFAVGVTGSATIRHIRLDAGRSAVGGAISSNGRLLLEDAILTNNIATDDGGALRSASGEAMVVRRVQFLGNSAGAEGGAIRAGSPGVRISDAVFEGNQAMTGGAVAGYDIHVRRSRFIDNTATLNGGAVAGDSGCSCSSIHVDSSTFTGNSVGSKSLGGAISAGHALDVRSSTFSGNSAGAGSAIHVTNQSLGDDLRISASTFRGNTAQLTGNALYFVSTSGDDLWLYGNIVVGNCARNGAGEGRIRGSGNVESAGSTCVAPLGNTVDVTPAQLALGPLADNGGPTPTMLPGPASIVIGRGSQAQCESLDQRGFSRSDGDCDAGSVEVGAPDDVIFRDDLELW
jgi:predicted outer membrane repeat protein